MQLYFVDCFGNSAILPTHHTNSATFEAAPADSGRLWNFQLPNESQLCHRPDCSPGKIKGPQRQTVVQTKTSLSDAVCPIFISEEPSLSTKDVAKNCKSHVMPSAAKFKSKAHAAAGDDSDTGKVDQAIFH